MKCRNDNCKCEVVQTSYGDWIHLDTWLNNLVPGHTHDHRAEVDKRIAAQEENL
jgi:hypothetical protein